MRRNLRAGVCVGAAIFRGDALLLLRRVDDFPGLWELPGGSVEEGESLEDGLRREVAEETGLAVEMGGAFYASTFEADGRDGNRVTVVAIEFLCATPESPTVRLSSEHDAFAWVRRGQEDGYPLVPAFVPAIAEAFRRHDGPTGPAASAPPGRALVTSLPRAGRHLPEESAGTGSPDGRRGPGPSWSRQVSAREVTDER